jgi:hypothetical protein
VVERRLPELAAGDQGNMPEFSPIFTHLARLLKAGNPPGNLRRVLSRHPERPGSAVACLGTFAGPVAGAGGNSATASVQRDTSSKMALATRRLRGARKKPGSHSGVPRRSSARLGPILGHCRGVDEDGGQVGRVAEASLGDSWSAMSTAKFHRFTAAIAQVERTGGHVSLCRLCGHRYWIRPTTATANTTASAGRGGSSWPWRALSSAARGSGGGGRNRKLGLHGRAPGDIA